MTEHHIPSGYSMAIVFGICTIAVSGILFWGYFLNVGTLILDGPFPFAVSFGSRYYSCNERSDCEFRLSPREYLITFRKDGYYSTDLKVSLRRGQERMEKVNLKIIPYLMDYTGSAFAEAPPLDRWGQVAEYQFNGENDALYIIGSSVYREKAGAVDSIVSFQSMREPKIYWSGGDFALVADRGIGVLVDLERKTKQYVFSNQSRIAEAQWDVSGQKLLMEVFLPDSEVVSVYRVMQNDVIEFTWYEPLSRVMWDPSVPESILFLSRQYFEVDSEQGFTQVIDVAKGQLNGNTNLYRIDLDSMRYELVLSDERLSMVDKMYEQEGKVILDMSDGVKYEVEK